MFRTTVVVDNNKNCMPELDCATEQAFSESAMSLFALSDEVVCAQGRFYIIDYSTGDFPS